ncbi:unnamed protein product, partial [Symbiodinium microadriaticum]
MFFDSSDPSKTDTGHQNEWADIEMPDGSVKKCDDPRGHTGHKWIGYTLFVPLDRPTAGGNAEQHTDDKSALQPKMLKVPGEPSESERRLHELTHLPFRDWCDRCVRSKGRQSHAVKKNDQQPVIQIDFSFLSTENDLPKRTILNATDVQTGYSMAVVLPAKGSIEKYAAAELRCVQDYWWTVDACSTDLTFSESRSVVCGDGADSTAFVMPPDLRVKGRVKFPPGLTRIEEEEENDEQLEDMVPGQSESLTVQDLLENDGSDRAPADIAHEAPEIGENSPKKARIDPDSPATEPTSKQMRISAVHHVIAGVIPACKWIAAIVGVDVVGKDGTKIEVDVNAE